MGRKVFYGQVEKERSRSYLSENICHPMVYRHGGNLKLGVMGGPTGIGARVAYASINLQVFIL